MSTSRKAVISRSERFDDGGRQSVGRRVATERAPRISQKTVGRPNPKTATSILSKAAGIVAGELRGILLVEDGELDTVEPGDASFGSDPKVSIASLENLVNTILRKAILSRPNLVSPGPLKVGRQEPCHSLARGP